ncbi:endonuclease [Erwinia phage FBB1]|nr:endonuclease [Erwinia phage FBB1]
MSNAEIHIRRTKLRRIFSTEFDKINLSLKQACKAAGSDITFHIKYSSHLLDRAIQREIDEEYVFDLFRRLSGKVSEVIKFLELPEYPEIYEQIDPNKVYRPLRLELTDGNLWLGMTVNKNTHDNCKNFGLRCRMAFVNNKRIKGKISTQEIYV